MRIAVWKTGHIIADTVANSLMEWSPDHRSIWHCSTQHNDIASVIANAEVDCHIGYGILRGMEEVFAECDRQGKVWFNVDRGYLNPGHYDGYYRISLKGTQQTIGLDKLEPDYDRLLQLGFKLQTPYEIRPDAHTLIVPPTDYVRDFFDIEKWKTEFPYGALDNIIRQKGDQTPLEEHLTNCLRVVTFNSSVGWKALQRGIPVYSDETRSIIGAYQKLCLQPLHLNVENTLKLFGIMASLQLTLSEIRSGKLCPLLQKLMSLQST